MECRTSGESDVRPRAERAGLEEGVGVEELGWGSDGAGVDMETAVGAEC